METYYSQYQYKNTKDVPKHKNIDFALYFEEFLEKANYKMLEIGCTTGNFLANDPENIIGIDINKKSLKIAKDRDFNVVYSDVENSLCFKDNSFDAVYASHVIEHLNNPILFLKECNRILKKDGLLVVITPNFSIAYKVFYDDPTHVFQFTKNSLKRCVIEAGFKNFKVQNQNVPTGIGLLLRKDIVSMKTALILARMLYKMTIYKYKWTIVLIAKK